MPVSFGNGQVPQRVRYVNEPNPDGSNHFHQRVFVTDRNGEWHEMKTAEEYKAFVDSLSPEELRQYELNYRFCSITNGTGNIDYTGTGLPLA